MESIIIKDSCFNSFVVQALRKECPDKFVFVRSSDIISDILFPFCDNLTFTIFYPDHLNKEGLQRAKLISQSCKNVVLIICISPEESRLYENFVIELPIEISAVICFPHEKFPKSCSEFIYDTMISYKSNTRKIRQLVQKKNEDNINPDIQSNQIFSNLVQQATVKQDIMNLMKTKTKTIQKTIVEGLPELLKCDFYLEPEDSNF